MSPEKNAISDDNQKKVIIVTRATAYEEAESFKNAIRKSCSYNDKNSLQDVVAKMLWDEAKNTCQGNEELALNSFGFTTAESKEVVNSAAPGFVGKIKFLMDCPYRSFSYSDQNSSYEVILVLYPNLKIGDDQKLPDMRAFLKAIIKDCNIDSTEQNILYIHDKQVLDEQKDDEFYSKIDDIDKTTFNLYSDFSKFTNYFGFMAVFGHLSYSASIFQGQILKKEFGKLQAIGNLIKEEKEEKEEGSCLLTKLAETMKKHLL